MFNTFPGKYISQSENAKVDVDFKNSSKNRTAKIDFLKNMSYNCFSWEFWDGCFLFLQGKIGNTV